MKEQFVAIQDTRVYRKQEKFDRSLLEQGLCSLCYCENIRRANFILYKLLTGSVFVTELSSNAGISV